MPEGTFVTVCGFGNYRGPEPFSIGSRFMCRKDPNNPHDDEAIVVVDDNGSVIGYLANSAGTRAGGTMSASRLYDRVGKVFLIEVWFTTRTKIICKVIDFDSMAH
ncbi:MAG: hypothetical protein IJF53_02410 [Clostridia bacterium]|nr:hypothetical protein [Clostridia bacterium]